MKIFQDQVDKAHLIDLLNLTDSFLSYVDTEYRYRAVNNAYKRKFNKTTEQIIGHYVWEVMGKEAFETLVKPNLKKAFLGATVEYEAWFEFPNLPRQYLLVTYKPTFTDSLNVDGVVVSVVDYTKFKELEEEKREQERLLQEVSKMAQLGEMISFIAHQWRQPLNTLASYMLKLRLTASADSEKAIERCELILEELSSHVESINNLRTANIVQSVDTIKTILESVQILIQERARILGINIQFDCSEPIYVSTHRDILIHVILAILENALDALSISKIENKLVTISARSDNEHIIIDIQDNGDGISCKNSKLIFNQGFTTKESSNRGYGLYFARRLLSEKLNGTIELLSNPQKGAWFKVVLPK